MIKEGSESRKEWLLYRFSFAGKFDHRIKNYIFLALRGDYAGIKGMVNIETDI